MHDLSSPNERRRFQRVLFDAPVNLNLDNKVITSRLIDISLKGALLKTPAEWPVDIGSQASITVALGDTKTFIRMQAHVAHIEAGQTGFTCDNIDMESITHLRRLVELNSGDCSLLERELQALG
ncbi:MAG: PilZ domain-containing protein [Gammaproteobacteria bacterium]|nr:PilZ domain-containing protein [Gammaproteobacteria bacterium]